MARRKRKAWEWSEKSWNPVTGCTKISQGCKNCYAEEIALGLRRQNNPRYLNGFALTLHSDLLGQQKGWGLTNKAQPKRIFVCSMSDLFHNDVPFDFISKVFDVIEMTPGHDFLVLTKRAQRLQKISRRLPWPDNLFMGVSIENEDTLFRVDCLRQTAARTKWLSIEPLIGAVSNLDLDGINWVAVGGESGQNPRPMKTEWVEEILHKCLAVKKPFFFKQYSGARIEPKLRDRHWLQFPKTMQALQKIEAVGFKPASGTFRIERL